MAYFIANADGNWSATASWAAVRNTPTIHATTNRTVSAGGIISSTFTAPNTTNAVTGVMIYVAAVGTAGTLTATLRESGIDTASTVSVAVTSLKTGAWMYLKLAAPYTYTTTAAGAYAWKLAISGGSGTTQVADNSGATAFAFMSGDDLVSAVPTTGDDVWNAGNNLSALTITVDNTSAACGSGAATGSPTARSITTALVTSHSGKIQWSTVANSTLTVKGQILSNTDGHIEIGTVASPIPSTYTAKLVTDQNGTDNNYDLYVNPSGNWKMQGAGPAYKKTTYASGSGTAASPLIMTDPVDWNVGDEFVITGQGSYNQHETRFIIGKSSATTFTVSTTAGGAEVALTYAHDSDDRIFILNRNVSVESSSSTVNFAFVNAANVAGAVDIDHAMCKYTGGTTVSRRGWQMSVNGASQTASADDFVIYRPEGWGISWNSSTSTESFTDILVAGNTTSTNVGSIVLSLAKNKTLTRCYTIGVNAIGFYLTAAANDVFTDCEAWNSNANNQLAGGIRIDNSFSLTFNNFVNQASRGRGTYLSGCANVIFDSLLSGNYSTNTIDADVASDTYNNVIFRSCTLSSATEVNNYLNLVPGSELRFHRLDDTDWNHKWYTAYGVFSASGPDCPDTTTVQTDHHSVRAAPEDSTTGASYEYKILARPGYYVSAQGIAQKNASHVGGAVAVSLFLPGSTTADATYTMPDNTSANPFSIGAVYSGADAGIAKVIVNCKSTTSGAYTYIGKLFNGTNVLTAMDTWEDGKPVDLMYPELGDPDSVWAVLVSSFTTSGTVGYLMTKLLTVAKFLGLK